MMKESFHLAPNRLPYPAMEICRFAPSASGRAHPGTLLAGLLAWLDARSRGARFILRIEDIDPQRTTEQWRQGLLEDLSWFGLDWDQLDIQSNFTARHHAALDRLHELGRLYPCACTKAELRRSGVILPDGSIPYPGYCRQRPLADWRTSLDNIRCNLEGAHRALTDESGEDLSPGPGRDIGDPVVRRRDGSITYPLAVVADDGASGVTRIVRGRDLIPCTPVQVALFHLLGYPLPTYRHHLLLLEPRGDKMAKFHGAVGADTLRRVYRPDVLCGLLAHVAGLQERLDPIRPSDLVAAFDWHRVRQEDQVLAWEDGQLHWRPVPAPILLS
jgi:glutamyl/glutaminyl-tRNA synthetase